MPNVWGFNESTSKNLVGVADAWQNTGQLKPSGSVGNFDWSQGNAAGFWYVKCTEEIAAATNDTDTGTGKGEIYRRKRDVDASAEFEATGQTLSVFNRSSKAILVDAFFFATRSLDGTLWALTPTIITAGIIRLTIGSDFDSTDATMTGTVAKSEVSGITAGDTLTVDNYIKGTGKTGDPALVYVHADGTYDLVAHACA